MTSDCILWTTLRVAKVVSPDPKAAQKAKRARYMRNVYRAEQRRIDCVLTQEEFHKVETFARSLDLKPTTLFRKAALSHLEQKAILPPSVKHELSTLTMLMRNMANNLNQIAKYTNTAQKLKLLDAIRARDTIFQTERLIKEYIETSRHSHAHGD